MIAHTGLAVRRFERSKKFYRAVLKPLGYRQNMEFGSSAGFFDGKNTDFWIHKAKGVVATHLAFVAKNAKQVQSFHKSGLAAGGEDNGAPGYRDYSPGYYAAFIIDLDGHNIEAVWYEPKGAPRTSKGKRT